MVRHYVRKRTFSTRERILIHLSAESLQPEEQTQDGVAAAVRSGRSTLTKWLDRMTAQGLLARRRVRLEGHPLPKYAYRLTERGWRAASALRGTLATQTVTVRMPDFLPMDVRLADLPALSPSRLDLTGAVAAIREGSLDITESSAPPARGGTAAIWGGGLRRVDRFFGRSEETRALDAWYASDSPALFVAGLAGIGKSALLAAWTNGRGFQTPVYAVELHPSTSAAALLADLGALLAAHGRPGLAAYLSQPGPVDRALVLRLLGHELATLPILVILDNADQASRDVQRLLREPFRRLVQSRRMKAIFLCRSFTATLRTVQRSKPASSVLRLRGLDREASRAILLQRGLAADPALVDDLIRATRGHPLLLHLAASAGASRVPPVRRYLEQEVWGTLDKGEQAVLEMMSVFPSDVGRQVLEAMGSVDPRTLDALCERNLLERTVSGRFLMHDLVRAFVQERVSDDRRRELHVLAARPLLRASDPRERWEGVQHLLEAGRSREAAAFLDSEGAPVLDCVTAEEIVSRIRTVAVDETDPYSYCVFAEVLGDSLSVRGHLVPALHQYDHAQRRAEASKFMARVPRILRKMAFIERCRNRYPNALGYLVEARGRLLEVRNDLEMAQVVRELALVERALGHFDEAAEHLNEAVDLATESSDRSSLARALLTLGDIEVGRGRRDRGLDYELEGLRIAEGSGDLTEVARAHVVLGSTFAELHRFEDALGHFDRGLAIARVLGNLRLMAYATLDRAAVLLDLGRHREAAEPLNEAKGYLEVLEERDTLALLHVNEGQLQAAQGRWSRAEASWNLALRELRSLEDPADLARSLKRIGELYLEGGRTEKAKPLMLEGLSEARRLGNATLTAEIEGALRRIQSPELLHPLD